MEGESSVRSRGGIRLDFEPGEAARLRSLARAKARRADLETRWAADPWAFLSEAVWTLDQRGEGGGTRKYPGKTELPDPRPDCPCGGCGNYLHHLVRVWLVQKRLLVPKSRRLLISWTMVGLHYWLARYHPATLVAFATRKQGQTDEEGSAELVKRVKFIDDHLPVDAQKRPTKYGFARFVFLDNDSAIVGIAQGADQARQYTYTAYLADEFAFWERAGETYAALLPTLEGGGRFTGVSSAAPGFMEQLVFDRWGASE